MSNLTSTTRVTDVPKQVKDAVTLRGAFISSYLKGHPNLFGDVDSTTAAVNIVATY